jgi:hypothetical protein
MIVNKINEFYEQLNNNSPKPKKEKLGYFTLFDKTIVSASFFTVHKSWLRLSGIRP